MDREEKEAMDKALIQLKEQMGPLVEIAEYMLQSMANSKIPNHISKFIGSIRESLIENGFTRDEAIEIIYSLDITSLIKQERTK